MGSSFTVLRIMTIRKYCFPRTTSTSTLYLNMHAKQLICQPNTDCQISNLLITTTANRMLLCSISRRCLSLNMPAVLWKDKDIDYWLDWLAIPCSRFMCKLVIFSLLLCTVFCSFRIVLGSYVQMYV